MMIDKKSWAIAFSLLGISVLLSRFTILHPLAFLTWCMVVIFIYESFKYKNRSTISRVLGPVFALGCAVAMTMASFR